MNDDPQFKKIRNEITHYLTAVSRQAARDLSTRADCESPTSKPARPAAAQPAVGPIGEEEATMAGFLEAMKLSRRSTRRPTAPFRWSKDFELEVKGRGEFIALIGHSGCGKSTVLQMIAGLNDDLGRKRGPRREGNRRPRVRTEAWSSRRRVCCRGMTARENVIGSGSDQVYAHVRRSDARREIVEYHLVLGRDSADAMDKRPGGALRTACDSVSASRARSRCQPKMLLLDEPFGMLDSLTRVELQEVLLDIWTEDRMTALMVTHDVDEALFLADRVVMMTSGPRARVGQHPGRSLRADRAIGRRSSSIRTTTRLRGELIGFLEGEDHAKHAA